MNKKHLTPIVLIGLGLLALTLTACNPKDEAEADRIRLEAQTKAKQDQVKIDIEATRVAVMAAGQALLDLDRDRTAQTLKSEGELAALKLKNQQDLNRLTIEMTSTLAALQAQSARSLAAIEADRAYSVAVANAAWVGPATIAVVGSLSALALVALVWGVSRAVVLKAYAKAATIWPNAAGQLPLIQTGGPGWKALVDPNRSPGAITTFNTPSLLERLRGRPDQLTALEVKTPLQISEAGHLQLAAQATAASMVAASTRHKSQTSGDVAGAVQSVAVGRIAAHLPQIQRIEPSHVEALLQLTEGEIIDD